MLINNVVIETTFPLVYFDGCSIYNQNLTSPAMVIAATNGYFSNNLIIKSTYMTSAGYECAMILDRSSYIHIDSAFKGPNPKNTSNKTKMIICYRSTLGFRPDTTNALTVLENTSGTKWSAGIHLGSSTLFMHQDYAKHLLQKFITSGYNSSTKKHDFTKIITHENKYRPSLIVAENSATPYKDS